MDEASEFIQINNSSKGTTHAKPSKKRLCLSAFSSYTRLANKLNNSDKPSGYHWLKFYVMYRPVYNYKSTFSKPCKTKYIICKML